MQQELWKDINGFEDSYEVSSFGVVRSKPRYVEYKHGGKSRYWPGVILKTYKGNSGYLEITLKISNKNYHRMIHRLVGEAFIFKSPMAWQINHKDSNKLNNHVDNLEWVSQSENMRHAFDTGNHSGKGATHYKTKKITDGVNIFVSTKAAAEFHGISNKTVWDMIHNRVLNRNNLSYL